MMWERSNIERVRHPQSFMISPASCDVPYDLRANPLPAIASNNVGVPMLPSATGPLLYAPRQTDRRRAKRIPISRVRRLTAREFTPTPSHSERGNVTAR
jgi:hypothetical protein